SLLVEGCLASCPGGRYDPNRDSLCHVSFTHAGDGAGGEFDTACLPMVRRWPGGSGRFLPDRVGHLQSKLRVRQLRPATRRPTCELRGFEWSCCRSSIDPEFCCLPGWVRSTANGWRPASCDWLCRIKLLRGRLCHIAICIF